MCLEPGPTSRYSQASRLDPNLPNFLANSELCRIPEQPDAIPRLVPPTSSSPQRVHVDVRQAYSHERHVGFLRACQSIECMCRVFSVLLNLAAGHPRTPTEIDSTWWCGGGLGAQKLAFSACLFWQKETHSTSVVPARSGMASTAQDLHCTRPDSWKATVRPTGRRKSTRISHVISFLETTPVDRTTFPMLRFTPHVPNSARPSSGVLDICCSAFNTCTIAIPHLGRHPSSAACWSIRVGLA